MVSKKIYSKIKKYYPLRYKDNLLPIFLNNYFEVLEKKIISPNCARIPGNFGKNYYKKLILKYSNIPKKVQDPLKISKEIVNDLFEGVLRWRSPQLQHNVGSPVNTVSSAIYSLGLDENIYNIDEGLAGNVLASEMAVSRILSKIAKLKRKGVGFFTFGGTATNLYATKMGLKKCAPNSGKDGLPKNIKVFTTEDSHFSHALSADWLGLGTKNVVVINANKDRTSSLKDAKQKMELELKSGNLISSILINGGTTYNHTVDSIKEFVNLRDNLVKKYSLNYKPHLHVDSVIGWGWLFFNFYDFKENPLKISPEALKLIKQQNKRISQLKYADSWGIDFHKGIGGCPVSCSVIMFNNPEDIKLISKTGDPLLDIHQLVRELNYFSPADFTLETSRQGGAPLSALACLHSLGIEGYQRNLANLIESTCTLRKMLDREWDLFIVNKKSLGFATLVRLYPPESKNDIMKYKEFDVLGKDMGEFISKVNKYEKEFYQWDYKTRILKNKGPSYSFSSSFTKVGDNKISAIKIYPTSPHYNKYYAEETAKTLMGQKIIFDEKIWNKNI